MILRRVTEYLQPDACHTAAFTYAVTFRFHFRHAFVILLAGLRHMPFALAMLCWQQRRKVCMVRQVAGVGMAGCYAFFFFAAFHLMFDMMVCHAGALYRRVGHCRYA